MRHRAGPARRAAGLPHEEPERLQKRLSRAGVASRREAEDLIRAGRITVNGEVAALGVKVSPSDRICLDGRLIHQAHLPKHARSARVFLCHRSPGESLLHALKVEEGEGLPRQALLERLPRRAGRRFIAVSPMPRVDGGLELLTSDGDLAARLQRKVRHLVSELSVRVRGELTPEQLQGVLSGQLDSGECLEIEQCEAAGGEGANRWYVVKARGTSGKEVRQLFERQGAQVSRVLRTHLGPIALERSLGRGHFRALTAEELQSLTADS